MATPIGFQMCSEKEQSVCIPLDVRLKHVHLIGRPGCGRVSLMERIILSNIEQGHGVAVLDPSGGLSDAVADCVAALHDEVPDAGRPDAPGHVRQQAIKRVAGLSRQRKPDN